MSLWSELEPCASKFDPFPLSISVCYPVPTPLPTLDPLTSYSYPNPLPDLVVGGGGLR